ncbi:MAG TPA: LD-carboxypeptidase [Oscillatoriaceae cyanobacterium M33_DOE_052]|uniref:LD-carboxypeptidase n=1 Tax=Planktothricoides sp. SpSt-374 TaxID=2282167 RepID=A0A7C3VJT1_9CYAN|nr:LD-carboxypeptidase [Oscillatoriaceae cyanobacterium M33_DOE_052]
MSNSSTALQFPPPLKPGDLLRVVAPSGCLRNREVFEQGLEIWRSQGYQVQLDPGYDDAFGHLAGTDPHRRQRLADAWQDEECAGILCVRGGFGASRLLEQWQWPHVATPKWLIGFSDITSLLWSLFGLGVGSVHGPVLTTLGAEPDWSVARLCDLVAGRKLPPLQGQGWVGGKARGLLLPANLTVATHLLKTRVQPDLDGVILAFEDIGEAPYRLDRALTQWRMLGAFQGVRGIALGRFSSCENDPGVPTLTSEEVLRDRLCDLGIPIIAALPFGHEGVNAALPVGAIVEIDGFNGTLTFESI